LKPGKLKNMCIDYLKLVKKGNSKISARVKDLGSDITEEELVALCKPFFRSSMIRMEMAGKEFEVDEDEMEDDDEEEEVAMIEDKTQK